MILLNTVAVWLPIFAIFFISLILKNLDEKKFFIFRTLLFISTFISGIVKQIYAILTGYQLWYLPLHFSSTFYVSVALSIFAPPKVKRWANAVLFIGGTIMLTMILFAPNAVLGDLTKIFSSPITFHGYFYHIIVIFQYFLIIAKREYHARNYDFLIFCTFVLTWAIIAVPFAFKFNANYMGIIKPFIPFFQRLLQYYGYPVYLLTYFLCVYTISFFITISYKKVCNLRPKKATLP